jgi:hypothetical protein
MIKRRDVLKLVAAIGALRFVHPRTTSAHTGPPAADPAVSVAALRGHMFISSGVDGHGRYWRGAMCIAPDASGTPILSLAHGDDPNVMAPLALLRLGRRDGATLHGILRTHGEPEPLPVDASGPLVLCPQCHGITSGKRCSICDGSGQVTESKVRSHLGMVALCRDIVADHDRWAALADA